MSGLWRIEQFFPIRIKWTLLAELLIEYGWIRQLAYLGQLEVDGAGSWWFHVGRTGIAIERALSPLDTLEVGEYQERGTYFCYFGVILASWAGSNGEPYLEDCCTGERFCSNGCKYSVIRILHFSRDTAIIHYTYALVNQPLVVILVPWQRGGLPNGFWAVKMDHTGDDPVRLHPNSCKVLRRLHEILSQFYFLNLTKTRHEDYSIFQTGMSLSCWFASLRARGLRPTLITTKRKGRSSTERSKEMYPEYITLPYPFS